jgi:transcriptional regulator with XRE-family HTH domain
MKCKTISEYLEKSQKTQAELAELLGVSQAHVSEIMNGKKRPSPELAQSIEKLTGIPLRDLLFSSNTAA